MSEYLCASEYSSNEPKWIEQDGKLYWYYGRQQGTANISIGNTVGYELKDVSATKKTLKVKFEILDTDWEKGNHIVEKIESLDYTLELINGRWLFTDDFHAIADYMYYK